MCALVSPDVPGGSILSSTEERVRCGFDILLSMVPFWLAGQAGVVQQLVTALEHLQVGGREGGREEWRSEGGGEQGRED